MTDRIDREHTVDGIGGHGRTEIVFCSCGLRCQNEDDGDDDFLAGYWRHIVEIAEQAVREQIAAEIEQYAQANITPGAIYPATVVAATYILCAEIARGRS